MRDVCTHLVVQIAEPASPIVSALDVLAPRAEAHRLLTYVSATSGVPHVDPRAHPSVLSVSPRGL